MELKRNSVIALHLSGKRPKQILSELHHLNINRKFVYRTIKRLSDASTLNKREKPGPQRTARSQQNVSRLKRRITRNPRQSARKLAKDMNISDWCVRKMLKSDLHLKPYKIQKSQELTMAQKQVRLQRAKHLKSLADRGKLPNIVFSDEKVFTVEQFVNKQNDRVWLKGKSEDNLARRLATRKQGPASVMVWAAVTASGRSPLVFIDRGVKINQELYRDLVIRDSLLPWAQNHFGSEPWTFQQDSAPSHKARETQTFLTDNVPRLISAQEWPPYSPDLNPMDFSIWSILQSKVCSTKHRNLECLKASLQREWAALSEEDVRSACNAFRSRLAAVVKARGGYIEQ